jgi:hypothetical protein
VSGPHDPRFTIQGVHGYRINDDGSTPNKRTPQREPAPEWSVLDRAFNARVVARFVARDGKEKANALAILLNEENEIAQTARGKYEPRFEEIIDAATTKKTHTATGRMRRNKGLRGEREVKLLYVEAGYGVRDLEGRGDHLVEGHPLGRLHSETKRQEGLEIMRWMRQAIAEADEGTVPVVVFRRSKEPWYVCMRFSDFLGAGEGSRPSSPVAPDGPDA